MRKLEGWGEPAAPPAPDLAVEIRRFGDLRFDLKAISDAIDAGWHDLSRDAGEQALADPAFMGFAEEWAHREIWARAQRHSPKLPRLIETMREERDRARLAGIWTWKRGAELVRAGVPEPVVGIVNAHLTALHAELAALCDAFDQRRNWPREGLSRAGMHMKALRALGAHLTEHLEHAATEPPPPSGPERANRTLAAAFGLTPDPEPEADASPHFGPSPAAPVWLSVAQLAEIVNRDHKTLRRWANNGKVEARRDGPRGVLEINAETARELAEAPGKAALDAAIERLRNPPS